MHAQSNEGEGGGVRDVRAFRAMPLTVHPPPLPEPGCEL